MTPDESLQVQFCGHTALIQCDDPNLRQSLTRYFRYCLGDSGPVVVTYQITMASNGERQLWRDGQLLHPKPTLLYIVIYLSQDLMAKLITSCQPQLVFHAAGLSRGQRGIILCGRSGSGKSTLSAWLTATGFDFLSDEIVAIGFNPLEMSGLAYPIVLKRGSAFVWQHWLGEEADKDMVQFFDGTAWLDPEQLRAHCLGTVAQPKLLLFPRYAAEATFEVRPLSPAEAAFRLMHHLVNFEKLPDQGFSQVTRLARQVKAYSLTYADVTTAATWLQAQVGNGTVCTPTAGQAKSPPDRAIFSVS